MTKFDFGSIATGYVAYRPHYPAALVDALRAETRGDTAWDVGCGSGQLSIALADQFARVIATDPAQPQLDQATPHPRVEYRCAPAETSGLADASVDLVVAAQAAHWFDWPRFLAEVERVARPGALVALVSYGNHAVDGPAMVPFAHFRDLTAAYWPPGREHVENGYRDLVMPWPAVAAPSVTMTALWTRDELVGYVSTWSATARLVETLGPAAFEELQAELATRWPADEVREVRWPLTVRFARR